VIGASVDAPAANRKWAAKYDLRMPLISDSGEHVVASAFGVARPMVGVAKRTTWLIDADGRIAFTAPEHVGASGVVTLPQRTGLTPATWLATWLELGISLAALVWLAGTVSYGRMKPKAPELERST